MFIAKNRIFSKHSSKKEKLFSIIVNIQFLAIITLGFLAYHSLTSINIVAWLSYIVFIGYTLVSYFVIKDNKNAHIGTSDWYASIINFKSSNDELKFYLTKINVVSFILCVYITFLVGVSEDYFEPKYLILSGVILTSSLLSIATINAVRNSKISESGIYLIDRVEVFNKDLKDYFKASIAEKIRKKGYVDKRDIYKVFNIINEQYIKEEKEKEKQIAIKKAETDKAVKQEEYDTLLKEYKKPLAYIAKN